MDKIAKNLQLALMVIGIQRKDLNFKKLLIKKQAKLMAQLNLNYIKGILQFNQELLIALLTR